MIKKPNGFLAFAPCFVFLSLLLSAPCPAASPYPGPATSALIASARAAIALDASGPAALSVSPAPDSRPEIIQSSLPPVVITVPGLRFSDIGWGPLKVKTILKMISYLFPAKRVGPEAVASALADYNSRFDMLAEAAPEEGKFLDSPDTYLEDRLAQSSSCSNFTVIPFRWSRDPADTQTAVDQFGPKLAQVYDMYKDTGRPIYILAHSWGSVIMHDVLHKLARTRPDIRIDKFITMGSPLMPGNPIVALYKKLQIKQEDLLKRVSKPANVAYWKNVWVSRDVFSNTISVADYNVMADTGVGHPENRLLDLIIHNSGFRKQAKTDLVSMINLGLWHKSYFRDFKTFLVTLNEEINLSVFSPYVETSLINTQGKR